MEWYQNSTVWTWENLISAEYKFCNVDEIMKLLSMICNLCVGAGFDCNYFGLLHI